MRMELECQLRSLGLMPIICQALLPPPAEWFPQEFMEIRRARVELILNEITEKIQLVSQEGKGP
jgi:hypothetical protein